MTISRKITLLMGLLLCCMSCTKDPIYIGGENPVEDKNIVSFKLTKANETIVGVTRGGEENSKTIHYGYIFYFNKSGECVGNYYLDQDVDDITGNGTSDISFKIEDSRYSNSYNLICVFNFDKSTYNNDFSDITKDNVSSKFPMSEAFLKTVEDSHNGLPSYTSTRWDVGMPMFVNDFADSDPTNHEIYSSLARLSISLSDDVTIEHESHFHPVSSADLTYSIVNYASEGSIGFAKLDTPLSALSSEGTIYDGVGVLDFARTVSDYVEGASFEDDPRVYLFEFPYSTKSIDNSTFASTEFSTKRFSIVLKHHDSYTSTNLYYKLDLADKLTGKYFDAARNHDYRIVIKAMNSRGYTTVKEAYEMPASNIEYEIYDDQGNLTYSNGQYAISMDEILNYDEVQIYGHATTNIEFNNIRYIMPEQMDGVDLDEMTNSVEFEIGDIESEDDFKIETLLNEFKDNPKLTKDARSVKLAVSGAGSCEIKMLIKLGNLEIGRSAIRIIKGAADGALDAHPCQIKYDSIQIVDGSWYSEDVDFGAWYDSSNSRSIVYIGENATPSGYQTMDGYVSGVSSKDSYPIFAEKERAAYYTYLNLEEENPEPIKTKIMAVQLAPAYLGHFGDHSAEGSTTQYNALIAERIEEIPVRQEWGDYRELSPTDGVLAWSSTSDTYYDPMKIFYVGTHGVARYHNLVEGLEITRYIVENNTSSSAIPYAAKYCYDKNDVNGNGLIDVNEQIVWYLPAQNQMLAMWINKTSLQADPRYDLNGGTGDANVHYWTSTENNGDISDPTTSFPHAVATNIIEGETYTRAGKTWYKAHVRCVRGVNH